MDLQHQQLKQLTDWLELTEGRIKRMGAQPMGPDLEDVKHQVEDHKVGHLLSSYLQGWGPFRVMFITAHPSEIIMDIYY